MEDQGASAAQVLQSMGRVPEEDITKAKEWGAKNAQMTKRSGRRCLSQEEMEERREKNR